MSATIPVRSVVTFVEADILESLDAPMRVPECAGAMATHRGKVSPFGGNVSIAHRVQYRVSYAAFLSVFLLLPIAAIFLFVRRGLRRFHFVSAGLVCLLAFVYTTPWDNYAAAKHLWSFAPSFVLGAPFWIGYLPLEEYLFYFAQAIFVCLTVIALARWRVLTPEEDPRQA